MLTSFSACAASINKTVLQSKVFTTPDYTRDDSYTIWNNIELHVGIIAASLPSLRPLFAAILDGAKGLTMRNGSSTYANTRQHKYYVQDESNAGGIKMGSFASAKDKNGYDVEISTIARAMTVESHDDTKRNGSMDSDDIFIMREGLGIMKSVDISVNSVHRNLR
jgi:hypothetical protein